MRGHREEICKLRLSILLSHWPSPNDLIHTQDISFIADAVASVFIITVLSFPQSHCGHSSAFKCVADAFRFKQVTSVGEISLL